jgi:hypothetical protein
MAIIVPLEKGADYSLVLPRLYVCGLFFGMKKNLKPDCPTIGNIGYSVNGVRFENHHYNFLRDLID